MINSPGQASVDHARGFSGARTRLGCGVGEGWCSSPGPRPTFSENPGEILGNSRARRKIRGVGAPITT